jgi:hypothetical protein
LLRWKAFYRGWKRAPRARQTIGTTTLNSGVSVEVKFHTTGGREYPKLTTLP